MKPAKIVLPFLILILLPFVVSGTSVTYILNADSINPQIAHTSIDTSHLGEFVLEHPRQLPFSSDVEAPEIKCIKKSNSQIVEYNKEVACDKLKWDINFKTIGSHGVDVSKQNNLYSEKGWWVLFEWGSIPRIVKPDINGQTHINICINQASNNPKCRVLPSVNSPPLILVWGTNGNKKINQKTYFTIYNDDKRVLNNKTYKKLMAQYKYLQRLLITNDEYIKDVDIVWIGNDSSIGALGGASGSHAYIANYAVKNNKVSTKDLSKLYWISGHETFHMLVNKNYPIWISESLAHYYGYKSLLISGFSSQSPLEIWQSSKDKMPHSKTGLYQASDKVTNENDMSYYGLFYVKGAVFWEELDEALIKKNSSLDLFIKLLNSESKSPTKLNDDFIKAVSQVISKEELSKLVAYYLNG